MKRGLVIVDQEGQAVGEQVTVLNNIVGGGLTKMGTKA